MISVTKPLDASFAWTRQVLFQPFHAEKWFILGFSAFLIQLGGGGGNFHFQGNPFRGAEKDAPEFRQMFDWAATHLPLVIGIGAAIFILIMAIGLVLLWVSSRGHFMFLDCVTRNVAEVSRPWREFRVPGNNLFVFRFLVGLAVFAVFLLLLALGWLIARTDIELRQFGTPAITAIVVCGLLLLVLLVGNGVVNLVIEDFIVPIMYRRKLAAMAACEVFWRELLPGHAGTFVLFFLLRFALSLGAAVIVVLGSCLTCCIAALPYLNAVAFLPVWVFFRSYPLYFLAQFDPEWQFLPAGGTLAPACHPPVPQPPPPAP